MKFLLISLFILGNVYALNISESELKIIGQLIYQNEGNQEKDNLIVWNEGEEFPSLGIGHFIWYPRGFDGPFEESFPQLKKEFEKQGLELPNAFKYQRAPWNSREEFIRLKEANDIEIVEAIEFLDRYKHIQVRFIYKRLEASLEDILGEADDREKVEEAFYKVLNSPFGLYPLLDYINFKGEGIKESERYNSYGWGMLQVLELMDLEKDPIEEFVLCAKYVLTRRVGNSPIERGEVRWIPGWYNRLDTYMINHKINEM